jgi:hypothetical protein
LDFTLLEHPSNGLSSALASSYTEIGMNEPRLGDRTIPRSAAFGESTFSQFTDYETWLINRGLISEHGEAWISAGQAEAIQRHWFWQGQVGCLFARRAARYSQHIGWETTVFTAYPDHSSQIELALSLEAALRAATASRTCQLQSFLFPLVRTSEQLVDLIHAFTAVESVTLARTVRVGDMTGLSLQARLVDTDVKAWLLGFGPFDHIPPTRRAPSVEVIIRPKTKPTRMFHRINQDRAVSHIADVPLQMTDQYAEIVWQETLRNVERILGHTPDRLTAATTTFSVPTRLWE